VFRVDCRKPGSYHGDEMGPRIDFRDSLGKAPPAFEWASLGIYSLSEMRRTLFDTDAIFFCREKGLQTQPRDSEVRILHGWFILLV
jgi:hypothetical protein